MTSFQCPSRGNLLIYQLFKNLNFITDQERRYYSDAGLKFQTLAARWEQSRWAEILSKKKLKHIFIEQAFGAASRQFGRHDEACAWTALPAVERFRRNAQSRKPRKEKRAGVTIKLCRQQGLELAFAASSRAARGRPPHRRASTVAASVFFFFFLWFYFFFPFSSRRCRRIGTTLAEKRVDGLFCAAPAAAHCNIANGALLLVMQCARRYASLFALQVQGALFALDDAARRGRFLRLMMMPSLVFHFFD